MQGWMQNGRPVRQTGESQGVLCDECPCVTDPCANLTNYYVDKYATGTGDGLSWENAFISTDDIIQPTQRGNYYIKGYGQLDTYKITREYVFVNIQSITGCINIIGDGDVWFESDGSYPIIYIQINSLSDNQSSVSSINGFKLAISGQYISISNVTLDGQNSNEGVGIVTLWGTIYNCHLSNSNPLFATDGFFCRESVIDTCSASIMNRGYANCSNTEITNCFADNCVDGFNFCNGILTDCDSSDNTQWGFYGCCNPLNSGLTGSGNTLGLIGGCP